MEYIKKQIEKTTVDVAQDHKGITLVALIITIIVMLILAGVTLSMAIRREWNI